MNPSPIILFFATYRLQKFTIHAAHTHTEIYSLEKQYHVRQASTTVTVAERIERLVDTILPGLLVHQRYCLRKRPEYGHRVENK